MGQVAKQLTGDAKTLVDFEGAVEVGVVDQTLPADCRQGFLAGISGLQTRYAYCSILTSLKRASVRMR